MQYRLIFDPLPLAVLALLVGVVAILVARSISTRTGFAAAGPVALIAVSPLLPPLPIALGIGVDDILPVAGVLLLIFTPGLLRGVWPMMVGHRASQRIALIGVALVIVAGAISALANGEGLRDVATLFMKSSGRYGLVALIALLTASAIQQRSLSLRTVAVIIAIAGTAIATTSLIEYFTPLRQWIGASQGRTIHLLGITIDGRLAGTTGGANFTAATLMVSSITTAGLAISSAGRERLALVTLTVVQAATIVLTYTRASMGLSALAIVLLAALSGRYLMLALLAVSASVLAIATSIVHRFVDESTNRLALWASALRITADNPLTGVGPGNMLAAVQANPERYGETPFGPAISTAHNIVLLAGAELGVAGLAGAGMLAVGLGLACVAVVIAQMRASERDWYVVAGAVAVLAFLAQSMTNNLMTIGVTSVFGAVAIGAFAFAPAASESLKIGGSPSLDQ